MKALLLPLLALGTTACNAQAPADAARGERIAPSIVSVTGGRALPRLTGRVVDEAGLIPERAETAMAARLAALEKATTDQLVVVTVPDLDGEKIEDLGLRLGNGWGVGQKKYDNGVLLIVATADRRARIEVGRGLEGLLTDEQAARILEERILPHFTRGDYQRGIEEGVSAITAALRSDTGRPRPRGKTPT